MLDHIGVRVADIARSKKFYGSALAPLGIVQTMEFTAEQTGSEAAVGYGQGEHTGFWIGTHDQRGPAHVAFVAKSNAEVDAFYKAALAAGGKDNGPPGPRPYYHEGYYGAFVLDPDGNNVEAVVRNGRNR